MIWDTTGSHIGISPYMESGGGGERKSPVEDMDWCDAELNSDSGREQERRPDDGAHRGHGKIGLVWSQTCEWTQSAVWVGGEKREKKRIKTNGVRRNIVLLIEHLLSFRWVATGLRNNLEADHHQKPFWYHVWQNSISFYRHAIQTMMVNQWETFARSHFGQYFPAVHVENNFLRL